MKIIELIAAKQKDLRNNKIPTIAFLGDSVTHGVFEIYPRPDGSFDPEFDRGAVYHNKVARILSMLYPSVGINIVNAGINGDRAPRALERLERDVLSHRPDLTVVCLGLNDAAETAEEYGAALASIFEKLKSAGSEVIFMTPNMKNTAVHNRIDPALREPATTTMESQNSGDFDTYINAARAAAAKCNVRVCDVYAKWKLMEQNGVDVTSLLSNYINHPTREMHWLFAYSLVETMMQP